MKGVYKRKMTIAIWFYFVIYTGAQSTGLFYFSALPGGMREILRKEKVVETRVAIIGIIVEDPNSIQTLNNILHDYSEYIVGRMGIPYRQKNVNVISIVVDAPQDKISALSGKIGKLTGVSAKAAYSNI